MADRNRWREREPGLSEGFGDADEDDENEHRHGVGLCELISQNMSRNFDPLRFAKALLLNIGWSIHWLMGWLIFICQNVEGCFLSEIAFILRSYLYFLV